MIALLWQVVMLKMLNTSNGIQTRIYYSLRAMMTQSNAGNMKIQLMIGFVPTLWRVMTQLYGVS